MFPSKIRPDRLRIKKTRRLQAAVEDAARLTEELGRLRREIALGEAMATLQGDLERLQTP